MECYLQSVDDRKKKIPLPHDISVFVGRNRNTRLTDLHLSREQVVLNANINKKEVHALATGTSYSGCNGYVLLKGETYILKHGDRLELLLGCHEYDVIFESHHEKGNTENNLMNNQESPPKKIKPYYPVFELNKMLPLNVAKLYFGGTWEDFDNRELLIFTPSNVNHQTRIAAFDLDGTIIRTKSGAQFPKDSDDWSFYLSRVPLKLKELYEKNYKIVIFTNQGGLKRDGFKITSFKRKIEAILTTLNIPIQVFVSTGVSIYRKPAPGMWKVLLREKNGGVTVDVENSFFVGDAAGREKNWAPKKHKDHSIGDRLFAINLKLKFFTPEEYFLNASKTKYFMPEFDPRCLIINHNQIDFNFSQEVILMVGIQGSGKSHYCKTHLIPKGYVVVNRDTLGTWQRCIKALEEHIQRKRSVVVDNTHVDKESRIKYIKIAKKYNIPCRCFVMSTTFKHSEHNNRFRELTDKSHSHIGEILLRTYKKQYQPPALDEGFVEIVNVPFFPIFKNPAEEELYKMFLLES